MTDKELIEKVGQTECFCGQIVTVGYRDPGREPVILHPQPPCARFLRDEPLDEFLKALRLRTS